MSLSLFFGLYSSGNRNKKSFFFDKWITGASFCFEWNPKLQLLNFELLKVYIVFFVFRKKIKFQSKLVSAKVFFFFFRQEHSAQRIYFHKNIVRLGWAGYWILVCCVFVMLFRGGRGGVGIDFQSNLEYVIRHWIMWQNKSIPLKKFVGGGLAWAEAHDGFTDSLV